VSLVLDASVVVAALDTNDKHHERCLALVEGAPDALVVPLLTLPEVDYLLRREGRVEVWEAFVGDIEAGAYRLHAPDESELVRAAELEREYADLRLGVVDASVIVTCETLRETKVATLDRRHFSVVRPRHCNALTLLPE
jgi:predicted nucleic acid-binding protein